MLFSLLPCSSFWVLNSISIAMNWRAALRGDPLSSRVCSILFLSEQENLDRRKMNYVDGNLVRGNYKAHNWQAQPSAMDKARDLATNAGYAVGLANTLREGYQTIRPALQGLGMIL